MAPKKEKKVVAESESSDDEPPTKMWRRIRIGRRGSKGSSHRPTEEFSGPKDVATAPTSANKAEPAMTRQREAAEKELTDMEKEEKSREILETKRQEMVRQVEELSGEITRKKGKEEREKRAKAAEERANAKVPAEGPIGLPAKSLFRIPKKIPTTEGLVKPTVTVGPFFTKDKFKSLPIETRTPSHALAWDEDTPMLPEPQPEPQPGAPLCTFR